MTEISVKFVVFRAHIYVNVCMVTKMHSFSWINKYLGNAGLRVDR